MPDLDIISGQGVRLKRKSGVVLKEEPFNFDYSSKRKLLRYELENGKGSIVTWVYELNRCEGNSP